MPKETERAAERKMEKEKDRRERELSNGLTEYHYR
jgi:hypothetical protein